MDNLLEFLAVLVFVILLIIFAIFCIALLFNILTYINNKALVTVTLDNQIVYSGRDYFVTWGQLGEVGNKYGVTVYKATFWGKFWGRILEQHVGKNLVVTKKEN